MIKSLKLLLRRPTYTLPAVACLALGLAAALVMLGVVDHLLMRAPEGLEGADEVRRLYFHETFPGVGEIVNYSTSYPIYRALDEGVEVVEPLGVYMKRNVSVGSGGTADQVSALVVSASFLELFGSDPVIGRWLDPEETTPGSGATVVVLGQALWRERFGGDRDVVGASLRIGDRPYTVVGVAPEGFTGVDLARVDLVLPLSALDHLMSPGWEASAGSRFLTAVGRLESDSSAEVAVAEASAVFRAAVDGGEPLAEDERAVSFAPVSVSQGPNPGAEVRVAVWLTWLALLVLLLAIANVANLQLTRAIQRQKELAVRLALGAGRSSLVGSAVTESVLLALGGSLLAVPLVYWGGTALRRLFLPDLVGARPVLDMRLIFVGVALAVVSGLVTSAVPALYALRREPARVLPSGGGSTASRQGHMRRLLLLGQVVLTFFLLAGAGLFVRSLAKAQDVDLGLGVDSVVVVSVNPRDLPTDTLWGVEELYQRSRERLEGVPGVDRVAIAAGVPLQSSVALQLTVPGVPDLSEVVPHGPYLHVVSPGYFEALDLDVVVGRGFVAADARPDVERVAVVNEVMAELVWPGGLALDRCLQIGGPDASCARVVGVIENAQRGTGLEDTPSAQYYVPLEQGPEWMRPSALLLRSDRPPEELVGVVRSEMQTVLSSLPYVAVRPLAEALDPTYRPWRLGSSLLGLFGALALLIALFGTYGVISYNVERRYRELGVRMALGARPGKLVRGVLLEGFWIGVVGIVLGVGLTLLGGRTMESLLFGVVPSDPLTLTVAALVLLFAIVAATLFPARRAGRVDPMTSLRLDG